MAIYRVVRVDKLADPDVDRACILLLERYVRTLEFRSADSSAAAAQLEREAAKLREANAKEIPDGRVRLMDVFERWKSSQRLSQTIEEGRQACELFIKVNGDLPVGKFSRQHGVAFLDHLLTQRTGAGMPLATSTHAKKVSSVRAVFFVAMDRDPSLTVNPLSRIRLPGPRRMARKARGVGPRNEGWSTKELQKLFSSPVYTKGYRTRGCGGEAAYWLPLLAIYTGARQSELAQLDVADFKIIKNIATLHITNETEDEGPAGIPEKRLKTGEMARRYIPVHAELLRLGFQEYVGSRPKSGKLFPEIRPGAHGKWGETYSKWFGRYRHFHAGIARRWADFHALRHTFTSACRAAEISTADQEYLTGHASQNVGGTYGTWSVQQLKKSIDRIEYGEIDQLQLKIPKWKRTSTQAFSGQSISR
jgi:integrase